MSAGAADGWTADHLEVRTFQADAAVRGDVDRAIREVHQWGGPTTTLVYNAAAMRPGMASALTADRVLDEMATNLGGAVASVQAVLPGMRACGFGSILFTGGGLALEPYPDWASLAAGKSALRAYALALHKELAPEDIRVSIVAVCGIVVPHTEFDPDLIADLYWRLQAGDEPPPREVVYLPEGADPFYNDPERVYRQVSFPIVPPAGAA